MSLSEDLSTPHQERLRLSGLEHRVLRWPGEAGASVMVMLHGWLDQASSMRAMAQHLSGSHQLIAPDLRGHGQTQWIGAGGYYHFFDYLRDIVELLNDPRWCDAPVWLLGHSMGGAVATLVAGARPERVRGLILLEGSGPPALPAGAALTRSRQWLSDLGRFGRGPKYFGSREQMRARLSVLYPEFSAQLLELFIQDATVFEENKGWRWHYDPLHRCSNPSPFQQEIYTSFAGAYPGPVLQIYGEQSPLARRNDASVLAREAAFPGPREVVPIPKARHMMHLTHPKACCDAIGEWVASLPERGAST